MSRLGNMKRRGEASKGVRALCRYKFTQTTCIHGIGCKNRKEGRDCRIGMRLQRTQLITGEPNYPAAGANVQGHSKQALLHLDVCTLPTCLLE